MSTVEDPCRPSLTQQQLAKHAELVAKMEAAQSAVDATIEEQNQRVEAALDQLSEVLGEAELFAVEARVSIERQVRSQPRSWQNGQLFSDWARELRMIQFEPTHTPIPPIKVGGIDEFKSLVVGLSNVSRKMDGLIPLVLGEGNIIVDLLEG
ncbi:MAG: hypothetical protein HN348_13260 [Proteobacteria bacterium]|nr:hypothetical protein [Pseudomonadota bacterium]